MTLLNLGGGYSVEGIDDLEKWLKDIDKKKSQKIDKFMRQEGNGLRKEGRAVAKAKVRKITGNYLKGFDKDKPQHTGKNYQIMVYNKAPHAHLLEDGHNVYRSDPKEGAPLLGYADGYKIMADAFEIYVHTKYLNNCEKFFIDTILGDKK